MVKKIESEDEFKTFVQQNKDKLIIIDFTAAWCGPCRNIAPVFEKLSQEFSSAMFIKVDVDDLEDIAAKYKISAMPTFIFLKEGEQVDILTGANEQKLREMVTKHTK